MKSITVSSTHYMSVGDVMYYSPASRWVRVRRWFYRVFLRRADPKSSMRIVAIEANTITVDRLP